jgi:hypothetical protein
MKVLLASALVFVGIVLGGNFFVALKACAFN